MPAVYTDAAAIAAALRLAPDTILATPAGVSAVSLSLTANQVAGFGGIFTGMYLALDQFSSAVREVVQVTGIVTGTGPYAVPVTATLFAHGQGAPVKEVSQLQDVVGVASRMVDDATFTAPGAFGAQTLTETISSQGLSDGRLFTRVTGRNVTAITAIAWRFTPSDVLITLDSTQCTFDDYQVWSWPYQALPWSFNKDVLVTLTYTSGYNPIPDDLKRAAAVIGARMFKEGDTGFSDVIGNSDMGLLQYKKGIPGDIALMLKPWRRWT